MNINMEYYKIFYYVAGCQSITRAAAELCISQPAVSQGIKQLERSLGTELFIRSAKGVRLTNEGQVLFTYVKNGYEQITLGEEKLQEMLDMKTGEIRIGASDMIVQFAVQNLGIGCVVQDFAKRYLDAEELFVLQFDKQIPKRQICVVSDERLPLSLAAGKLMELLMQKDILE